MLDLITHYCIDSLMESNRQLEEENSSLSKRIKEAEQHQESTQQQYIDELNRYKETIKKLKNNLCGIDKMEEYIQKSSPLIEDLEKKAYLCENERRKLHNKLQELRGNIRVIARVRPLLESEPNQTSIFFCLSRIF